MEVSIAWPYDRERREEKGVGKRRKLCDSVSVCLLSFQWVGCRKASNERTNERSLSICLSAYLSLSLSLDFSKVDQDASEQEGTECYQCPRWRRKSWT